MIEYAYMTKRAFFYKGATLFNDYDYVMYPRFVYN